MSTAIQILKKEMQLLYRVPPTGVCRRVIGPGGLSGEEESDFSATVPAWESAANRFSWRFMFIGPGRKARDHKIPAQAQPESQDEDTIKGCILCIGFYRPVCAAGSADPADRAGRRSRTSLPRCLRGGGRPPGLADDSCSFARAGTAGPTT